MSSLLLWLLGLWWASRSLRQASAFLDPVDMQALPPEGLG